MLEATYKMMLLQPAISHLIVGIFVDSFGDSDGAVGVGSERAYGELYEAEIDFEAFDAENAAAIPILAISCWSLLHLGQVQSALKKYQ